jgi:hypothetical protein
MRTRRAYLGIMVLAAATALAGCSREPGTPRNTLATAEETVRAYCDLDAQGARLTSTTWPQVLPYIAWTEEAGFDRAIVISGFTIGTVQKKGDKDAMVTVEYRVLGAVSGDYVAGRRNETVRFRAARTDRGWKITEPDFMPPHVGVKAMVKHLEGTKRLEAAAKVGLEGE